MTPPIHLRPFARADLAIVDPWFRDRDTRWYLGGPEWPASMLDYAARAVGMEFRGAIQTGAYRYLAQTAGGAIGYIDCGTFDRCTVYGGEGNDGPIITESIDVATGSIAFVIDTQLRRRRLGGAGSGIGCPGGGAAVGAGGGGAAWAGSGVGGAGSPGGTGATYGKAVGFA